MSHQESAPPEQQKDHLETQIPDPEVVTKAKRRKFTAEYKLRIVEDADACTEAGQIGALLRREGMQKAARESDQPIVL